MFQRFLNALSVANFKARSADRDTETDRTRVNSISRSIEEALESAKTEQAGLKSRIDDTLARSAITLGNNWDEYLTRDPEDTHYQKLLGSEISEGQRRLIELEATIGHIQFLKSALATRFPDFDFGHNAPMQRIADPPRNA